MDKVKAMLSLLMAEGIIYLDERESEATKNIVEILKIVGLNYNLTNLTIELVKEV